MLIIFLFSLQEPFNAPIGTYNSFPHPMGGGQPPELPSCPPTYESVSDRALHVHALRPFLSQQTNRRTGQGITQGRTVYSAFLQFCLPSILLHEISELACLTHMDVPSG